MRKTFDFKLAGMRKPQNWIVCPVSNNDDGSIYVQSDKSIGKFDPNTGKGVLNTKGTNFVHLYHASLGAKPFIFPQEFVDLAKANSWAKGEKIGSMMVIG